jgi:hypothetical protein
MNSFQEKSVFGGKRRLGKCYGAYFTASFGIWSTSSFFPVHSPRIMTTALFLQQNLNINKTFFCSKGLFTRSIFEVRRDLDRNNLVQDVDVVSAGSEPRPRTKRVKIDCALSADYYNINEALSTTRWQYQSQV